ncbi:unnamed protein product [Symbiodinium sp. KB8]|nr:unnamed protein product [Symbiodinium sp. KB8]
MPPSSSTRITRKFILLLAAWTSQCRGATPDIVAFATAIAACASGSRWELVLVLLHEMSMEQLEPPVVAYNAALTACTSAVSWATALALHSCMQGWQMAPEAALFLEV